jgi:hypothetical protein
MVTGEDLTAWAKPERAVQWTASSNRNSRVSLRPEALLKIMFPSFRPSLHGLYLPHQSKARVIAGIDIPKKLVYYPQRLPEKLLQDCFLGLSPGDVVLLQ